MRVILSPYAHELNGPGTACAEDCPACRWVEENLPKKRARMGRKLPKSSRVLVTSVPEVTAFSSTEQGL